MTDKFSAALGSRLRAARRQRGWSLADVEGLTEGEYKASVVGAYERGERAMSVQRLVRLAEIYSVAPNELLPITATASGSVIDLDQIADAGGDIAERYVAAIHLLRSTSSSAEIRSGDRAVLSSLLEVESQTAASES